MFKKILIALWALAAAAAFAAVDVNKATPAELDSVKGIGPAISGKIVDERKNGDYKDWNDLITRVKGVGAGNAKKLSAEGLTVNGASYSGAAAPKEAKSAKATTTTTTTTTTATSGTGAPAASASDAKADAKKAAAEKKAAAKAEKQAKAASAAEAKKKSKDKAMAADDKASDAKAKK